MQAGQLANDVKAVQGVSDAILKQIEELDPAAAVPAAAADLAVTTLGDLVTKALTAWSNASGIPITGASVAALAPNATPLTAPDA